MTNHDLIPEFESLFARVDATGRPEIDLVARWLEFVLRAGTEPRTEAGATMLTAIRLLALAADKPGLQPAETAFVKEAMRRAERRIKMFAEDLVYRHRQSPFPWMPDSGGEGG
jgi:hypothetical protein